MSENQSMFEQMSTKQQEMAARIIAGRPDVEFTLGTKGNKVTMNGKGELPWPEITVGPQGGVTIWVNSYDESKKSVFEWALEADQLLAKQVGRDARRGGVRDSSNDRADVTQGGPGVERISSLSDVFPERTANPYNFVLQFPPSQVVELVSRRLKNVDEENAMAAGRDIARGNHTLENVKVIVHWKSARRAALLDDNKDTEIAEALRVATDTGTTEAAAMAALIDLHGVGVPVASAILTAINPTKYTIIDFRALTSLGSTKKPPYPIKFYLAYLAKCRELAQQLNISLRTLDHALWQWYDHPERKAVC